LGWAQLTFAQKVDVSGDAATGQSVTIQRVSESGFDTVEASVPAVVSVVEKINEPRYPSFKGIMAAKKKPVETLSVADAGLDASQVGLAAAWSRVDSFAARPPKAAGVVVVDEGDGGVKAAAFLADQKFI
jgi:electron transfer flavoprotein beta subunit